MPLLIFWSYFAKEKMEIKIRQIPTKANLNNRKIYEEFSRCPALFWYLPVLTYLILSKALASRHLYYLLFQIENPRYGKIKWFTPGQRLTYQSRVAIQAQNIWKGSLTESFMWWLKLLGQHAKGRWDWIRDFGRKQILVLLLASNVGHYLILSNHSSLYVKSDPVVQINNI